MRRRGAAPVRGSGRAALLPGRARQLGSRAVSASDVAGIGAPLGGRFQLVSYLPTYAATVFLLLLVWAGAPGQPLRFDRAWRTAAGLGLGEVVVVALVVTLVALLLHPLQLRTVRLLEGDWPRLAAPLARLARHRQERRCARLV